MLRKILVCMILFIAISSFSYATNRVESAKSITNPTVSRHLDCGKAPPPSDPNFCGAFRQIAQCHCTSSGLPSELCVNMDDLYDQMISIFGSQQNACSFQQDTPYQTCMDDWNCYRLGGKDSNGQLCSQTGKAC